MRKWYTIQWFLTCVTCVITLIFFAMGLIQIEKIDKVMTIETLILIPSGIIWLVKSLNEPN